MSYIDGFRHELVGLFAAIPVYHPLKDIPPPPLNWPEDDFGCTTDQLVFGGGSGEHPGLVVCRPQAAVARFVLDSGDFSLPAKIVRPFTELTMQETQLNGTGLTTRGFLKPALMPNCQIRISRLPMVPFKTGSYGGSESSCIMPYLIWHDLRLRKPEHTTRHLATYVTTISCVCRPGCRFMPMAEMHSSSDPGRIALPPGGRQRNIRERQ